MNTKTPIDRRGRFPGRILAVLGVLLLLGGCTTYSTRYYADDAGYGYYDPAPVHESHSSVYVGVGYGYGYADPWVYPYWSLDQFYFGPYGYAPWHPVYSSWAYVPLRYRAPFGYGHGYGYGFGYGLWGWSGHGYASWVWPFYGHGYYGYGGGRHHDSYSGRHRAIDPRTRSLAAEAASTPTRRALLGGARGSSVPPRPILDPARTRADLLTNAPSRAALRGQLGESSSDQRRAQSALRSAPATSRASLRPSHASTSRSFDRPANRPVNRPTEAPSGRRTLLAPASGSAPESTRQIRGGLDRSVIPGAASSSNRARAMQPSSPSLRPSTARPSERSRMLHGATPRVEPPSRSQPRSPTSAREATLRRAAPPPAARSAPVPRQRATAPVSRPAVVPSAPRSAPPPRATPPRVSAPRPTAPPRSSGGSDRRRDGLSGRRSDGRR